MQDTTETYRCGAGHDVVIGEQIAHETWCKPADAFATDAAECASQGHSPADHKPSACVCSGCRFCDPCCCTSPTGTRLHSWRDQEIARRVETGANSSAESAAWSVDYSAGYARGQSDGHALLYRAPTGANDAYTAGYERGYAWARKHAEPVRCGCGFSPCLGQHWR